MIQGGTVSTWLYICDDGYSYCASNYVLLGMVFSAFSDRICFLLGVVKYG